MPGTAIRDFLLTDLTSTTASSVYIANTDLWNSASEVPDYAYKSLKDIWVGTAAASSEYASRIVEKFGLGKEAAEGDISIIVYPAESVQERFGYESNRTGSETAYVEFVLKLPQSKASWLAMKNAELRIRYLLDHSWRDKRKTSRTPPTIPSTDKSIIGRIDLFFDRYMAPPDSMEYWIRYFCSYDRAVPK